MMRGSHRNPLFFYLTLIARTTSPLFPRAHFPPSSSPFCALDYCTSTKPSKELSFTVNYLIKNCGFLPDSALHVSKYVLFEKPEKPDSVLALFRSLGFSDSQLHLIVRRFPRVLLCSPRKTLLPKLQFLISKGASTPVLSRIITLNPVILQRSLKNQLIPTFDLLNNFIQSDEKTIISVKRAVSVLSCRAVHTNIAFLVDAGVSEITMARLLRHWPMLVVLPCDFLKSMAEEVMGMGIHPSKASFVTALYARTLPKSMWDKKVELYKRLGWTDDVIREAFVRHPFCMLFSEKKIEACFGFLVNQLGWDPLDIAGYPLLLSMRLEKRIVPRASVLESLVSKGLAKSTKLMGAYTVTEEMFLKRYVTCFKDDAPQLLKLYQEKMNLD